MEKQKEINTNILIKEHSKIGKIKKKGSSLVVAFSGGEMERGIKAAEVGVLGETRIAIQEHPSFH